MSEFDRIELGKQAKQYGFVRDTYEKVCRLSQVLAFIENDNFLNQALALKGGTAINLMFFNLPRLSVDIDLDFIHNLPREEMIKAKELITEKFHTFMRNQGYTLEEKNSKTTHALNSSVFSYMNTGGVKDRIKIEINYMLREHILKPEMRSVKEIQGFSASKILCINPIEIYGAKITALISRGAARDLYDVNSMLKSQMFSAKDLELLRKCVVFYKTLNSEEAFNCFDFSVIDKITFSKIKADLLPVISSSEKKFALPETITFVKEQLEELLQMTPKEIEFVERYFKKDYRPELLFDSGEICSRLKSHPMVQWKYSKMELPKIEEKKPSILAQIKSIKAEQDKHNQAHNHERSEKKQNISNKKDCL